MTGAVVESVACAMIGGGVAAIELVGRYRDSPQRLVLLRSFWIYVVVNATASVAALLLARENGWSFGSPTVVDASVVRVVAAGVAGLVILRSGIAVVRVGDRDVPAGPGALITGLLAASERVIDRTQARQRSEQVAEYMRGVSFDRSYKVLPKHCLLLLRNATADETQALAAVVAEIADDSSSSDQAKAYNLGVALINFAGPDVLKGAVTTLGEEIRADGRSDADLVRVYIA